jgi:hypothetical protein
MVKPTLLALTFVLLIACGGTPPREKPNPTEPYVIISSLVNPATNELSITIKVDPPYSEEKVKGAAEMVIEKNRSAYKAITVKSFLTADASGIPYAVSRFDGQGVTHQINPQAAPQKIPSH